MKLTTFAAFVLTLCLLPTATHAAPSPNTSSLDLEISTTTVVWKAPGDAPIESLRVAAPDGTIFRVPVTGGVPVLTLETLGAALGEVPDGAYTYEVTAGPERRSGAFRVLDGRFVHEVAEESEPRPIRRRLAPGVDRTYISDDLSVNDSLCVGAECAVTETFGLDTIRLREDNVRMVFYDTSDPASGFTSKDWEFQINDLGIGQDRFSIRGVDDNTIPFTLVAGAPDDSLFVDAQGRVGLGTAVPEKRLHVSGDDADTGVLIRNDSPTVNAPTLLSLETNGEPILSFLDNSGTPSDPSDDVRWLQRLRDDEFRISKDATGGPEIIVRERGDVGGSTLSVDGTVYSNRQVWVSNSETPTQYRVVGLLANNGPAALRLKNTTDAQWDLVSHPNGLILSLGGTQVSEFVLKPTGDLVISGTLTENSNRHTKTVIEAVDSAAVLAKVAELPLATWQRKGQTDITHLGPMAQDFRALFGLGRDETSLSPIDLAGVALAAVQELKSENDALRDAVRDLTDRLEALEDRPAAPD